MDLIQEIVILHRKGLLGFQTLFKVELSYLKAQKVPLLPSLSLLLTDEEPSGFFSCSVEGSEIYVLEVSEVIIVCIADSVDSQNDIKKMLNQIAKLLDGKNPKHLKSETSSLTLQIKRISEESVPSRLAGTIAKDIGSFGREERPPVKIIFLGLSQAGKTTIYRLFFDKSPQEDLSNIFPTLLQAIHKPKIDVSKGKITIADLGGQSQYISQHLKNPHTLAGVNAIVFVVDIRDPAKFAAASQYFSQIVNSIVEMKEKPSFTVILHKFDPKNQNELLANLPEVTKTIGRILERFRPSYFFTSIYDPETIERALTNVLFRALPIDVLEQTLTSDILLEAFERIVPIYERIKKDRSLPEEKTRLTLKELSKNIGFELAKRLATKWHQILCEDKPYDKSTSDPMVRITQSDVMKFEIICPLPVEKYNPNYCWVTHGLIEGLAIALGFGNVQRQQTMIMDNAPPCLFTAKYS